METLILNGSGLTEDEVWQVAFGGRKVDIAAEAFARLKRGREIMTGLAEGGKAIYGTVEPENSASWYNFEKEGYVCVVTQPAYDGRDRRYYKLTIEE